MGKKVWKYTIPISDYHLISMPLGAEILSFQLQYNVPTLWALVDTSKGRIQERRFKLVETGRNITERGLKYIGTIKMVDDKLIYHLFEY